MADWRSSWSTDTSGDVGLGSVDWHSTWASPHKGHSLLGEIVHAPGAGLHWTAKKAALAGHDLKAMPVGLYEVGKGGVEDVGAAAHGDLSFKHTRTNALAVAKSTVETLRHPLRDPFQTALLLSALATGGAGLVARGAEASAAIDALDAAGEGGRVSAAVRAAVKKPTVDRPGLRVGAKTTELVASKNPARGYGQVLHDKTVQKALDKQRDGKPLSKSEAALARYGYKRVADADKEFLRNSERNVKGQIHAAVADSRTGALGRRKTTETAGPVQQAADDVLKFLGRKVEKLPPEALGDTTKTASDLAKGWKRRAGVLRAEDLVNFKNGSAPEYFAKKGMASEKDVHDYWNTFGREVRRHQDFFSKNGMLAPKAETLGREGITSLAGKAFDAADVQEKMGRYKALVAHATKVKQGANDVLIAVPTSGMKTDITRQIGEIRGHGANGEWTSADAQGAADALDDMAGGMKSLMNKKPKENKFNPQSTLAPKGFMWVNPELHAKLLTESSSLRLLQHMPKTKKWADAINAWQTSLTVYTKLGHLPTRVGTNLATTLMQGSVHYIPKTFRLWQELKKNPADFERAMNYAGKHAMGSLPQEGAGKGATLARAGANWYGRHADAPFRINNLYYEAGKMGFNTPEKFIKLLNDPKLKKDLDEASRRGNRASISYDRLSDFEANAITRLVWFYPWVRGSSDYLAHSFAEHPYKGAALGAEGQQGRKRQQEAFGELPSFAEGLVPLRGGKHSNPLVSDFSTFSPYATPGEILGELLHNKPIDYVMPADKLAFQILGHTSSFGSPTAHLGPELVKTLEGPSPEGQMLQALQDILAGRAHKHPHMFSTKDSPWEILARAGGGPSLPRHLNPSVAHSTAERQKQGR